MFDKSLQDIFSNDKSRVEGLSLRDLFAAEADRFGKYSIANDTLLFDYSKQRIDDQALKGLLDLARARGVEDRRDAMFGGEKINTTEDRSVLHVALRNPASEHVMADGQDVMPAVHDVLKRLKDFTDAVRSGERTGATGKRFETIINIGIGGSQLGPEMLAQALAAYSDRSLNVKFVSNVDGDEISEELLDANPETTLFIVASKTFTTDETMTNARSARAWLAEALGEDAVAQHFVAVSTNHEQVSAFGIQLESTFGFWDWVGGRYSVGSSIGLPVMIMIGYDNFRSFLDGMHAADEHFRTQSLEQNIPVIMGLADIWNGSVMGVQAKVIAPYSHYLKRLPAYLQQMVMESNGKSTRLDGSPVLDQTSMAVFGQAGTDAQHAYFQQVHQGTTAFPVDFVGFVKSAHGRQEHQRKLLSNMTAQSEALAFGKTLAEVQAEGVEGSVAPHKIMPGNRPSNTILFNKLDPFSLGYLIALYEHSVFVQGTIWGINSYDQWGVELGKKLAKTIEAELEVGRLGGHDSSTSGQLQHISKAS